MQMLQWLFKVTQEQAKDHVPDTKRLLNLKEEQEQERNQFKLQKGVVACQKPNKIVFPRINSRNCFYYINLNIPRNLHEKGGCICTVREECSGHREESAHPGSKILARRETVGLISADNCKSNAALNKKRRAVSRAKELIRWAAAAKSENGANRRWKVLYFRNRGALKAPHAIMSSSSTSSFRWDTGSCSTSAFSPLRLAPSSANHGTASKDSKQQLEVINKETSIGPKTEGSMRKGHWITTDADFVVLELRS